MKRAVSAPRSVLLLSLCLLLLEFSARIYVDHVKKTPPLTRADAQLGWKGIPDLVRDMQNPDGDLWRVELNENGFRESRPAGSRDKHRTIFLGDSFVFGEGVDIRDRFDSRMSEFGYPGKTVNFGVSGYSTDQELMAATGVLKSAGPDDSVVLVTFGDDFKGLLSGHFAGRAKPVFHLSNGTLALSPAAINPITRVLDNSYIFLSARKIFGQNKTQDAPLGGTRLKEALSLYGRLLSEYLAPLTGRGAKVLVVFHGKKVADADFGTGSGEEADRSIRQLCLEKGFTYLAADPELSGSGFWQAKGGHWNAKGHKKFAELLGRA